MWVGGVASLVPSTQPAPQTARGVRVRVGDSLRILEAPPDEQDPVHQTWRFSGRWWNKPTPLRRDRPWARR